jgi:hypothetical protein
MQDGRPEPFDFPAIGRKKLIATFDGGRLTSTRAYPMSIEASY